MVRTFSFILLLLGTLVQGVAQVTPLKFTGDDAASIGIVVRSLVTGQESVSYNPNQLFCPASTMKLVTSAAALSTRGENFKYATSAYISGKIVGNRVIGDIVIVASGDPTLYSEYFKPEECTFFSDIVAALKKRGIKEISGNIVIGGNQMPDQGPLETWEIEDLCYSYGAGYFALNFADNVFRLNTESGVTTPFIPDIDLEVENIGTYRQIVHGINSNKYVVTGPNVFNPKSNVTMPMNNPSTALIAALTTEIERNDIVFIDAVSPAQTDSIPLAVNYSQPLPEILHSLMVRSDNMMAESALRLLAPEQSRDSALTVENEFLKSLGISTKYCNILDGSGLSRANAISPRMLADVLQKMALSPVSKTYINLFPRAGVDGTMKSFLAKSRFNNRLAMKTGSMSGVRCYAGYLLNETDRPTHVVVIMVNHYHGQSSAALKNNIEQFILQTLK